MTVSTENAPPQKFAKAEISDSSVQNQITTKISLEFVPRDTGKCEFLVLLDIGGVAF